MMGLANVRGREKRNRYNIYWRFVKVCFDSLKHEGIDTFFKKSVSVVYNIEAFKHFGVNQK